MASLVTRLRREGLPRQLAVGLVVKGAGAACSLAFTWLIARAFGPAGAGSWAAASSTLTLIGFIGMAGLDVIVVRAVATAGDPAARARAKGLVLRVAALTVAIAGTVALTLALARGFVAERWFQAPALAPFLGILAFTAPLIVFGRIASSTLRGTGSIARSQALEGLVGTGTALALLGAALAFGHPSALAAPIVYLAGWALSATLAAVLLARLLRDWGRAAPPGGRWATAGVPIVSVHLAELSLDWVVTLILTQSHGLAAAGLYRVANLVGYALFLLTATVESVLQPPLAAAYAAGDTARLRRILRGSALGLAALTAPVALVVFLFPHQLLRLFGPNFEAAASALQIGLSAQVVALVTAGAGSLMVMAHREWLVARVALVLNLSGMALAALLIPRYGLPAASLCGWAPLVLLRLFSFVSVRATMRP